MEAPPLTHLFAYGTLMDPEIMRLVSGGRFDGEPAELAGYVRRRVAGEVYPAITSCPGATVRGIVYREVTPAAFQRLDAFEGSRYQRVAVTTTGLRSGRLPADAYVLSASHPACLTDRDWSFEEFLRRDRSRFLRAYRGSRW